MTKEELTVTRREALAGVGAVGFTAVGVTRSRSTGSWDGYTNYTYAETEGPTLLVGWQGTYNGTVIEDGPVDPEDAVEDVGDVRLVDLDDVLPGDAGTASVGLRTADADARIWARLVPASGALAERLTVDLRYDTGFLGVGGCGGADETPTGEPVAAGSLAAPETASGANGDLLTGVELDPGILDNGCLPAGSDRCLALHWELSVGEGNVGMGETAAFDLTFRTTACEDPNNPFGGEVEA